MEKLTPGFAEILGLLCAEGSHIVSYSNYWGKDKGKDRFFKNDKSERIEFYNKDVNLLKHYQKLLFDEFSYTPKITKHGKINICTIHIIRRIINHTCLGTLKWQVPKLVKKGSIKVKISFLRGYFDGDGTVSGAYRMFSCNKGGLLQVSSLLDDLKIEHTIQGPVLKENRKPSFIIHICKKEKERFLKTVKPISKRPDFYARVKKQV
jgi:intein/homing endonuclease